MQVPSSTINTGIHQLNIENIPTEASQPQPRPQMETPSSQSSTVASSTESTEETPKTTIKPSAVQESEVKLSAEDRVLEDKLCRVNKYFKRYNIDVFTHFQDLRVRDVVEIAVLDLLSATFIALCKKLETGKLDATKAMKPILNCFSILKQERDDRSRFLSEEFTFHHSQVTSSFSAELNVILSLIDTEDKNYFTKHLNAIIELGNYKNLDKQLHEFRKAKDTKDLQWTNQKFLTTFGAYTIHMTIVVNVIYDTIIKKSSYVVDELSKIIQNLRKFGMHSTKHVTIELGPGNSLDIKKADSDEAAVKQMVPLFEKLKKLMVSFRGIVSQALKEMVFLKYNAANTSQLLMEFYNMNARLTSLTPSYLEEGKAFKKVYQEFKQGKVIKFSLLRTTREQTPKDPIQEYFEHTIRVQDTVCEGYLSASHFFTDRFFPLFKAMVLTISTDWRDHIDFDSADPSQMSREVISKLEIEGDEKVEAESSVVPKATQTRSRKSGKRASAASKSKTHKQVITKSSNATAILKEGRKISPAIVTLYDVKSQIDARMGFSSFTLPAEMTGKPLSRSMKASANQSHAINVLALITEMLQYPHCYDKNGEYTHMGKTLIRFAALQASLACEQSRSAEIYAEDPWKTLSHNQATYPKKPGRDASHPAISLLQRETLLYRFPKMVEVGREEVVSTWPKWLGDVVQYNAADQPIDQEHMALQRQDNIIATRLTAEQTQKISDLESELRELAEAAQKMAGGARGDKHIALVIIYKHLNDIRGFVQAMPFFCHQAFAKVLDQGINLGAQTLLEYVWVLSSANAGKTNIIATLQEENALHQIARHIDAGELAAGRSDVEKSILKLLDAIKAFEYLPGHCADREEITELPQLDSDLLGMARASGDTQKTWADKTKAGLETEEAVDAKLKLFVDRTTIILNTVCKVVRPLVA